MVRTYILLFFAFFFCHLHITGNINKYINMKYAYISYIAIGLFVLLMIVQAYFSFNEKDDSSGGACCGQEHGCGHDHHHEASKPFYKRWAIYLIFLFPLYTGLFLPVATLDSTIVKSKGFSFKTIETTDAFAETQYLKPDTSIYYGPEGYEEYMEKELQHYLSKEHISLNEENYLKGMETIYKYPGYFLDKTVEFDGFTYKEESTNNNQQLFVLRFGIIHCVADSGVYGMLVEFPKDIDLDNDKWVHVKGRLSSIYYQPFKANIPYLLVEDWKRIDKPEDPYVYRGK